MLDAGKSSKLIYTPFILLLVVTMKTYFTALFVCFGLFILTPSQARAAEVGYYSFEPDIIVNYISQSRKKLGYIRITADLMLINQDEIEIVEHHAPLLRDAIVEILSQEPESKIKSIAGREEVRKKCLEKVKSLLKQETGHEVIRDLLFTKYIYH